MSIIRKGITVMIMLTVAFTVGFTTSTDDCLAAVKTPAKVSSLKVTKSTYNSVTLKWKKAKRAKKYAVYQATSKNGKYSKVKTTKSNRVTVKKLDPGKKYWFKVRAINGKKKGKRSKAVSVRLKSPTAALQAPSVKVSGTSETTVSLSWTCPSAVDSYNVYRNGKKVASVTSKTYTDTGLTAGTTYTYRVEAVSAGRKAASSDITAVTENSSATAGTVYIDYSANGSSSKTRLTLGQKWTTTLKNGLASGSSGQDVISRPQYVYSEDYDRLYDAKVYCFDVGDYDNYIAVTVANGKVVSWDTTCQTVGVEADGTKVRLGDIPRADGNFANSYYVNENCSQFYPYQDGGIFFGVADSFADYDIGSLNLNEERKYTAHIISAMRVLAGRCPVQLNLVMCGDSTYGAQAWAETMKASNLLTHEVAPTGPLAGMTMTERGTYDMDIMKPLLGDNFLSLGENCRKGVSCAEGVFIHPMYSISHMKTMMGTKWTQVGIGMAGEYACEQYGYYR